MKKLLFLFALSVSAVLAGKGWWPPMHDETCGFTRDDAYHCIVRNADQDHDGKITREELGVAMGKFLPWYMKFTSWKIGPVSGPMSVDRIFKDCDYNKDGILTPRDWQLSTKTCLPSQQSLCAFQWFCE